MASPAEEPRFDARVEPEWHDRPTSEPIGDLLRRTRESYGQDLGTVAMQLRIRNSYLRAIEEGRFKDLPGSTYAVGFVRTYAEYLGLDAPEVLRRFREEVSEVNGQPQLIFPAAAAEGKFPGGAILFLSVMLAAIAYGSWYYMSDRQVNLLELIPSVPEHLRALVSGEAAPEDAVGDGTATGAAGDDPADEPEAAEAAPSASAAEPEEPVADDDRDVGGETSQAEAVDRVDPVVTAESGPSLTEAVPTAADETAAPAEGRGGAAGPLPAAGAMKAEASAAAPEPTGIADAATDTPPQPDPASPPPAPEVAIGGAGAQLATIPAAPTVPPADDEGQVFGTANVDARIVLHARLESWVQVTDANETTLLTRILRAGDSYLVPNEPGLTLTTGNAGGLDILVDGRQAPPLGPVGVVRRGILLDPARLIAGTALPE